MRLRILAPAIALGAALSASWSSAAAAETWLELLHGWNYNRDFNGGNERTILRLKTFQPFSYGSVFIGYSITGPFTAADAQVVPNEKNGMGGSISVRFSIKKIGQKIAGDSEWRWGALHDLSLHLELEHTARVGAVTYLGAAFDVDIPFFDFFTATTLVRQDWALRGVDLELGAAWSITAPLGRVSSLVLRGSFAWGVFGEGRGVSTTGPDANGRYAKEPVVGRPFFITQPQLLLDIGKLVSLWPRTLYAGIEYQLAWNRYQLPGVTEHVPQLLFKWAI